MKIFHPTWRRIETLATGGTLMHLASYRQPFTEGIAEGSRLVHVYFDLAGHRFVRRTMMRNGPPESQEWLIEETMVPPRY